MILGKLSAFLCGTVTGWLLFWGYRVLGEIVMAGVQEFGLGQKETPEVVRWNEISFITDLPPDRAHDDVWRDNDQNQTSAHAENHSFD